MAKYRITKIHPNCKPGLRSITGKQVDAVLEVPAGTHLLAHGQVIETEDVMSKENMMPTGNCPICRLPKISCKGEPACWMAEAHREAENRHSLMEPCPACKQAKIACQGLPECMTAANQRYKEAQGMPDIPAIKEGLSSVMRHLTEANTEIHNVAQLSNLGQYQEMINNITRLINDAYNATMGVKQGIEGE